MSSFSSPLLSAADIIRSLSGSGFAVKQEDLANPSSDFVCNLYTNILDSLDPLGFDPDGQVDFGALELLENPDHHRDSIRKYQLFHKMKGFLSSIQCRNFVFSDILRPDPVRSTEILSSIINFILHMEEKMKYLQPIVDRLSSIEEQRAGIDEKISQLNREILGLEAAREMDQPVVKELDAEVKNLKQTVYNYNKEHMSLKSYALGLREKTDAIGLKVSEKNLELVTNAQENSRLLSKIVQSPDKLQGALEEKKKSRTGVMDAERSAMLNFKERTSKLEVYSVAMEKMSRHLQKIVALQEQVTTAKALDKEVKALKTKISDDGLITRSLEAQIVEGRRRAKQALESVKAMEKERDLKNAEDTKKFESLKSEMDWKLQSLEQRELKAEAMVAKGEKLNREADSIREAGKAKECELLARSEKIIDEFHNYSNFMDPILRRVETEISCYTLRG